MEPVSQNATRSPEARILVIMAKAPKPGRVKTRLSQSLPMPAVTELYCCLLQDTVALAKSLTGVEVAIMCPESDSSGLARLLGDSVALVAQTGEGLTAGLTSVFRHFTAGGRTQVIAFNSDSPHLPASVLEDGFGILNSHDVVIGPTLDGGYYLVGAKTPYPTLFEGDGMGTTSALDRLLGRTRALQLSTGFTQSFYDIDVADDLIRLAGELGRAPGRAPRTAQWIKEWAKELEQLRRDPGAR
jgi:uncharacterized protein